MKTLEQLLQSVAFHVNGDTVVPTVGDDDYLLWTEALNQAQGDWATVDFNWPSLRKTYRSTILQSGTSVALPQDFVKLDGFPQILGTEYPEVAPEEAERYAQESFVTVDFANKYLTAYPAMATTADIAIRYWSTPTALATLTAVSPCPADNYLVYGAVAKILFGRDDGKYVEFENKANTILGQMIGKITDEGVQKDTRVKNVLETKHNFTLGVD